jgi:hypothetical protein
MIYYLIYKKNDTFIKEKFDFNTNPIFFEQYNINDEVNEELIKDDMQIESEAIQYIKKKLEESNDILYFSIIEHERKLYHKIEDFTSLIY